MHTHTHTLNLQSPLSCLRLKIQPAEITKDGPCPHRTKHCHGRPTHSPHCSKTWRYKRPHKELSLATKYGGAKNRNAIHFQICSYRHCCYALLLSRNRNKTFRTRHRVLQKSSKVFGQNEKRIALHPSSK